MRRLALLLLLAGCGGKAAPAEAQATDAGPRREAVSFFGSITPRTATPLYSPSNMFRIKGWNSRSNWIKLMDLAEDGAKIEKGKEVARFEFDREEALVWIKQRIIETQADLDSARTASGTESDRLRAAAEVRALDAESAELDTQKEGLVSDRDLDLLHLELRRASTEGEAASTLARASEAKAGSESVFLAGQVDDWKSGIERYASYESRSHVLAPHDGIVRYGYLRHRRRKVQKSDEMPSGTPFVLIAEDERLSVEVLVPEQRIAAMKLGATLHVRLPDGDQRFDAVIRKINAYPEEIGFLRGDDDLPDAREKAYVVTADFDEAPASVSSGVEVRVEP